MLGYKCDAHEVFLRHIWQERNLLSVKQDYQILFFDIIKDVEEVLSQQL